MTPAEFKAAFPVFAAEDDAVIQRHINRSPPYFNVSEWRGLYTDALGNWVAHYVVMEHIETANGTTGKDASLATSKTVGRVSVSYSDKVLDLQAKDPFMRTTYGREYLRLLRLAGTGAVMVISGVR
jgi:hypothetical protein